MARLNLVRGVARRGGRRSSARLGPAGFQPGQGRCRGGGREEGGEGGAASGRGGGPGVDGKPPRSVLGLVQRGKKEPNFDDFEGLDLGLAAVGRGRFG